MGVMYLVWLFLVWVLQCINGFSESTQEEVVKVIKALDLLHSRRLELLLQIGEKHGQMATPAGDSVQYPKKDSLHKKKYGDYQNNEAQYSSRNAEFRNENNQNKNATGAEIMANKEFETELKNILGIAENNNDTKGRDYEAKNINVESELELTDDEKAEQRLMRVLNDYNSYNDQLNDQNNENDKFNNRNNQNNQNDQLNNQNKPEYADLNKHDYLVNGNRMYGQTRGYNYNSGIRAPAFEYDFINPDPGSVGQAYEYNIINPDIGLSKANDNVVQYPKNKNDEEEVLGMNEQRTESFAPIEHQANKKGNNSEETRNTGEETTEEKGNTDGAQITKESGNSVETGNTDKNTEETGNTARDKKVSQDYVLNTGDLGNTEGAENTAENTTKSVETAENAGETDNIERNTGKSRNPQGSIGETQNNVENPDETRNTTGTVNTTETAKTTETVNIEGNTEQTENASASVKQNSKDSNEVVPAKIGGGNFGEAGTDYADSEDNIRRDTLFSLKQKLGEHLVDDEEIGDNY